MSNSAGLLIPPSISGPTGSTDNFRRGAGPPPCSKPITFHDRPWRE